MPERTFDCPECGTFVRVKSGRGTFRKRYCSVACQRRAWRRENGVAKPRAAEACGACGADLSGFQANKLFCSQRCHSWNVRNPGVPHPSASDRRCKQCAADITARDVRSEFCGATCRERYKCGYVVGADRECAYCGGPFKTRRKSSRHCSDECMRRADYEANKDVYISNAARRRAVTREVTVERFLKTEIFERDNWTCYLCGEAVDREAIWPDPAYPSLDHVIPISRGGSHSRGNARCAHLGCNLRKGDRLMAEGGTLDALEATAS